MGYRATWQSTDQIPERAIASGLIDRFGAIDSTDGGDTSRSAVIADWQGSASGSVTRATAYAFHYDVDLFSNFTYALDDPENGDQFEQTDSRFVTGGRATHRRLGVWGGRTVEQTFGTQLRNDAIGSVGLFHTRQRERLSTIREDRVRQTSGALFYANRYQWSPLVRTELGLRADLYHFRVDSDTAANSGTHTSGIVSPKAGVVIGPMKSTEFYANAGLGFHSNDARGTTITVDPQSGDHPPTLFELRRGPAVALAKADASRVTPLVRARGAEIGLRTVAVPRTQLTVTLWTLALDSELRFVGDAGTTEASRPSRRTGIEATAYYRPRPWVTIDADIAASRARFTDGDPAGRYVPGSVQTVLSGGVAVDHARGLFASARLRYFGPRPLIEDDRVRSQSTSLVNLQGGYRLLHNARVVADVFNLFDRNVSDIDYFYTSRLPGEPAAGIEDIHLHPALPRSVRVSLQVGF